ncbi:MAG: polysaccharide deacetylase family protein [Candidatus Omnitrophica bacterium]|nr:polysaccharide deacetylase family protein [Candidatus Omnitrophota bacterium]
MMNSRRHFLRTTLASGISLAALSPNAAEQDEQVPTRYIAAYDTESPTCLKACRKIVEAHKKHAMPATFFVVGKTLEANASEYRSLLDDPLFEIASHTYSHRMLRDHPFCGGAISLEEKRVEIFKGKEAVERVFERPCLGVRSGCGFDDGLRGAKDVLALVEESGMHYVSTLLWGPDYSLPALLTEPFSYKEDGFPDVWELPGHGWHENILKNHNRWGSRRVTLWPPLMPEAIPAGFVEAPEDEFAVNRVFLDRAKADRKTFASLIWHPWSLHQFDPEMRMLDLTFAHVRKIGLSPCRYADLYETLSVG